MVVIEVAKEKEQGAAAGSASTSGQGTVTEEPQHLL